MSEANCRPPLRGAPDGAAVLLAVELCSLVPKTDPSMATVVGSSLFGDGAAEPLLPHRPFIPALGPQWNTGRGWCRLQPRCHEYSPRR